MFFLWFESHLYMLDFSQKNPPLIHVCSLTLTLVIHDHQLMEFLLFYNYTNLDMIKKANSTYIWLKYNCQVSISPPNYISGIFVCTPLIWINFEIQANCIISMAATPRLNQLCFSPSLLLSYIYIFLCAIQHYIILDWLCLLSVFEKPQV